MSTESALLSKIKELETELQNIKKQKRYGLVWEDKPESIVERCKTELPVLVEDESRRITEGGDAPTHILIEGDNYPALSVLAYTHEKQVDVIYIDPPYNTGNRDFSYNDTYVDREDSFRHSKWLSFISKRLEIAKKLLKDTGIIFITIDDNESAQLKLLCDEIFEEKNEIAQIIWQNKYTVSSDAKFFSKQHDYIFVYAKDSSKAIINLLDKTDEAIARYKNPDNDPRGPWKSTPLDARSGGAKNKYEITFPNGKSWSPSDGRYATYSQDKLLGFFEEGRLWFGKDGSAKPSKKTYLSEVSTGMKCSTIFDFQMFGHNHQANDELAEILGKGKFSSPKPKLLIKQILKLTNSSVVLDFFAGSGTTGHAVLELNREDGGNRQAILVTNNENQIAETVTYPRMQRVIEGYADVAGIPANLRYYRTEFIAVDRSIDDLRSRFMGRCNEMLCIRESCYDRVEMADTSEYLQVFENRTEILAILYHPYEIERFERWARETTREIVVYIFSMGVEIFQEELAHLSHRIRIETIPDEILETYKKIFGF